MKVIVTSLTRRQDDLELDDDQLSRNDEIDNAVFECITILSENPNMQWDMQIINETTDAIKEVLHNHDIKVRHPHVVTNLDGTQTIEEYEYENWGKFSNG